MGKSLVKRPLWDYMFELIYLIIAVSVIAPFITVAWLSLACYLNLGDTYACQALGHIQTVVIQ
jgi:hypothetical protein